MWYFSWVQSRGRRMGSRFLLGILAALLAFVALIAWALASPIGASPDEDFHLVSMWCGQGDRDGLCEPVTDEFAREVPAGLLEATCYVFESEESAACQRQELAQEATMVETTRGNFSGSYPPLFYFVASFFVGDSIIRSALLFRAANAALFVMLIAAAALLCPAGLRRAVILAAVTTAVPLSVFLISSINPSSWAISSALVLGVSVLGYLTAEGRRRRIGLGALAGVALLVGAGARADASVYAAIAIVGACAIALSRERQWRRHVYPAMLFTIAVVFYLSAGQSSAVEGTGERTAHSLHDFLWILPDVPSLWAGNFGTWALGWFDTPMPPVVWFSAIALYAGMVFAALGRVSRMQSAVLLGIGAALVVIPAYMQYLANVPVGSMIQPRYVLPLLVMLVAFACLRLDGEAMRLSRVQWLLLVTGLSVANAIALHRNIRRYVTGVEVDNLDLGFRHEWWWTPGTSPGPMAVWAIGAIAFAGAVALATYGITSRTSAADAFTVRYKLRNQASAQNVAKNPSNGDDPLLEPPASMVEN